MCKIYRGFGEESDANLKKLWRQGEYVYNETGEDDRFDDIYPMVDENGSDIVPESQMAFFGVQRNRYADNNKYCLNLSHLLALVCVKMRVISHLEAQECVLLKQNLNADTSIIASKIGIQIKLLDKYLKMTHKQNKYILHILSNENNIRKMREQEYPEYYSANSLEEAYLGMDKFARCMARSWGLPYLGKFLIKIGETVTPDLNRRR